jgi:hypothetical protein
MRGMPFAPLLLAALLMAGCDSSGTRSGPPLTATVDVTATTETTVGGSAFMTVAVTNTGPAIPDLGLVFFNGDLWYARHAITDAGGCTIDPFNKAFDCGDLAAGATTKFAIVGVAKDAGNFQYELALKELDQPFDFVNNHADGIDVKTWSEQIGPA